MPSAVGQASPPAGSSGFQPRVGVRSPRPSRNLGQDAPGTGRLEARPTSGATHIASCRKHCCSNLGKMSRGLRWPFRRNKDSRGIRLNWACFPGNVRRPSAQSIGWSCHSDPPPASALRGQTPAPLRGEIQGTPSRTVFGHGREGPCVGQNSRRNAPADHGRRNPGISFAQAGRSGR